MHVFGRRIPIIFLLTILTWLPIFGQSTGRISTQGALGYHEPNRIISRPVAVNDTTLVVARPSAYGFIDRSSAGLIVQSNLLGNRESHFISLPGIPNAQDGIWSRPYRLDDETVVMPSTGQDGVLGTIDDMLTMVGNLHHPGIATIYNMALGRPGVRPDQEMVVLGPRTVAYVSAYRDSISVSGTQEITIVHHLGQQNESVQVIDLTVTIGGGTDGHLEPMGPGRFAMVLCGSDFVWGTDDDAIGKIELGNNAGSLAVLTIEPLHQGLRLPIGSQYPHYLGGDRLFVFGEGGEPSPQDDVELVISSFGAKDSVEIFSLANASPFRGQTPPLDSFIDASGAAIRLTAGPDQQTGTFDDQIYVRSRDTFEILNTNAKLADDPGGALGQGVALDCGTSLVPMFGRPGFGASDVGLFIISAKDPNGAPRSFNFVPIYQKIDKIVPMTATTAMAYTDGGGACFLERLDSNFPSWTFITGEVWDHASEPTVINPAMVVTSTSKPLTAIGAANDDLILFEASAIWNFGQGTDNNQGFELRAGSTRTSVKSWFPTFEITLEGAPPNQVCALFISLHRDAVLVAPDVPFLLSFETMIFAAYDTTGPDGTSKITLPTPTNGAWIGRAAQYQWFVANPASARGWELSNGLTASM